MRYLSKTENAVLVRFHFDEIQTIVRIIPFVLQNISEGGLHARFGFFGDEISHVFEKFKEKLVYPFLGPSLMDVEVSKKEFLILNQSFNEVCNGLKIENFEEKIGSSKTDVETIFTEFRQMKRYFLHS